MDVGLMLDRSERATLAAWHGAQHALAAWSAPMELTGTGWQVAHVAGPVAAAWLCLALVASVVLMRAR